MAIFLGWVKISKKFVRISVKKTRFFKWPPFPQILIFCPEIWYGSPSLLVLWVCYAKNLKMVPIFLQGQINLLLMIEGWSKLC